MGDVCKVIAGVTVETLRTFGKSKTTAVYVCTAAGVYAAPTAPLVCGSAAIATAVGSWATTEAGKRLMKKAAEKSCNVVVRGGEILLVEGKKTAQTFAKSARQAEQTYRALNTSEGIQWLMNYLAR